MDRQNNKMTNDSQNISIPDSLDFTHAKLLVVGDVMLDRYWHGDTTRISPEAPVPVVKIDQCEDRLGGAANVASNIKTLGAQVCLIGIVGFDEAGDKIKHLLHDHGVSADLVEVDTNTCTKLRVIGRSQQLLRCDFEKDYHQYHAQIAEAFQRRLEWADAVIFSDYAKGALTQVQSLIKLARAQAKPILVDPKGSSLAPYVGATMLTPNFKEFKQIVGQVEGEADIEHKAKTLIEQHQLQSLLVTRGSKGMSLFTKTSSYHVPALAREVYDITGAGDTVIAALGCALGSGLDKQTSAFIANVAAGLVVAKLGTAQVSIDEINQALNKHSMLRTAHRKVVTLEAFLQQREKLKKRGQKLVFTNGCFDILHAGHVTYLAKARNFGDGMIIAVNSDESVRKLKGPTRPIHTLSERMQVLAALDCVDWVIPFSDDTPLELIKQILPDVLVKGADYKVHEIAGSDVVIANGGTVKLVALVDGCSTTSTVHKIQEELVGA